MVVVSTSTSQREAAETAAASFLQAVGKFASRVIGLSRRRYENLWMRPRRPREAALVSGLTAATGVSLGGCLYV